MRLSPLVFSPVRRGIQRHWRKPDSYAFLDERGLGVVPVALSELLNLAHHLPLLIQVGSGAVSVVAPVGSPYQSRPLLDDSGAWLRPYMPLALRCLPFGIDATAEGDAARIVLTISDDVGPGTEAAGHALFDGAGELTPQVQELRVALMNAHEATPQLTRAAELLLLTDVLAPVRSPSGSAAELYTADPARLPGISNRRAAILVRDDFWAMHLLFALLFSRRWLSPRLHVHQAGPAEVSAATDSDFAALNVSGLFSSNFALDDGELVPTELFE